MSEEEALGDLIRHLARCAPDVQAEAIDRLSQADRQALAENWPSQTHEGQQQPGGDWRTWLIMAGRGFGKTRTGAEWVLAQARAHPGTRIALVGGTIEEAAKVMVEGESGILACARLHEKLIWRPSTGKLKLPGGSLALLFSGANPGRLRGPQHQFAWADELGNYILDKAPVEAH